MVAQVKILLEGYTNAGSEGDTGEEKTQPTITLVRDGDIVMVVDPGVLESQQLLIDALNKENLSVKDVNVVCITHSHIDHYRNIGMFPDAKTLEYFALWNKNTSEDWSENFTDNIKILRTPGHDYTGITLLVNTEQGKVAICGDVFWKEDFPKDPHDDAYASNPVKLKESRDMILKIADFIIPGHGTMYKSTILPESYQEAPKKFVQPSIILKCKKCSREMKQKDKCQCRPFLCYRCCECALDCYVCSCSHRVF
ncbi:MAG: MBL fold metallo-hydrolase [Candidatus Staskawiczbacteria bacterium]|jgi:glyoxylase-like metal-dependent hydrolase (beta-lactamase superfamily II)